MIDAHTHFFAEEIVRAPHAWAQARSEHHWASTVLSGYPHTLQAWPTARAFVEAMDTAGIEKAALLGWYWEQQETCEEHFAHYLRLQQDYPGRFYCFAPIQPLAGPRALAFADRALDQGAVGFGECLPFLHGHRLEGSQHWLAFGEWCAGRQVPINFHVTEAAGHPYPGRIETPLSEYLWLARQFPDLKMILAHWGGGLPFFELNPRVAKSLKNVYYDTAASPRLYNSRVWQSVLDIVGPERVIWGSDYSLTLYNGLDAGHGLKKFAEESSSQASQSQSDAWAQISQKNFLRVITRNI